MDSEQFWAIVAKAEWKDHRKRARGFELSKRLLKKVLPTTSMLRDFRERFGAIRFLLDAAVSSWEEATGRTIRVGDDSYDDLLADIIGHGVELFDAVSKSPLLAFEIVERNDVVESFNYAVPYEDEYESHDDELSRRRRRRDAEITHAVEYFSILLEEAVEDAQEKFSVLHKDDVVEALRRASSRWALR